MYGGLLLGHSQDAAVNFLMEKENIAHSIKLQYEDIDAGTRQSMSFVKEQVVDPEREALKKRIAELEAANATKEKMEAPVEVIETPEERFAKLKTKAKDLGIKGFALPHVTEEKLLKMIEEHESKLEQ
jgi:sialic acid synthase SpsE